MEKSELLSAIMGFSVMYKKHELSHREKLLISALLDENVEYDVWKILDDSYGKEFCVQLQQYIKVFKEIPNFDYILDGYYPDTPIDGHSCSMAYAITHGLIFQLKKYEGHEDFYKKLDNFVKYLTTRLHVEFAVYGLGELLHQCPDIDYKKSEQWVNFEKENVLNLY